MKLGIISLGCPKNTVDTECMLSILGNATLTVDPYEADAVLINTCAFLKSARDESSGAIADMFRVKKEKPALKIMVAGCFVSKDLGYLQKEFPQVHAWLGINDIANIKKAYEQGGVYTGSAPFVYKGKQHKAVLNGISAYVKISEGCDHACSFCAIPGIKGRYRSREISDIVSEVKALTASGIKEINIISQDLTYYGTDNYKSKKIAQLLKEILRAVKTKFWLRLLYLYPDIKAIEEISQVMKKDSRVCRYIDIPFQHISDSVLKSMRRGYGKKRVVDIIELLRSKVPGITLRSSFITGYPGETKKDFKELQEFIKNPANLDRCGIFPYSDEPGTHANTLKGKIRASEIRKRREILLVDSASVYTYNNQRKQGSKVSCLVLRDAGKGIYVGRTEGDAPDIDGYIEICSGKKLKAGDFVTVKITGTKDMDLKGEAIWTGKK